MSHDFFADLERQLVAATADRRARIRRARARRAATMATIAVAVVAAGGGLAAAVTTSGGSGGSSAGHAVPTTTREPSVTVGTVTVPQVTGKATTSERRHVTIAVLNGTTVPGLARGVANRLIHAQFLIGNVTNAAAQDQATTTVSYASPASVSIATQVAATLQLGPTIMRPITTAQRVIAGDQARVVVVVGSDQNNAPLG